MRFLALLAIALWGTGAYAACDTSQPGTFLEIDPPNPTLGQTVTITSRMAGWDVQSTSTAMHGNTLDIVVTGTNGSFQPQPPIPCQTSTIGPLAAGRYTINVIEAPADASSFSNGGLLQEFNVGLSAPATCAPSDRYLEIDPISPNASQPVSIKIFPRLGSLGYYGLNTAVTGNRIDVTLLTYDNLITTAPGTPSCLTQLVGPLDPGTYTVNLKTMNLSRGDSSVTLEAVSFMTGQSSLPTCNPGAARLLSVDPASPNDQQPVTLMVGKDQAIPASARTQRSGNTFNVTLSGSVDGSGSTTDHCLALDLGVLSAGTYGVNLSFADSASPATSPQPLANSAFTVSKGAPGPITGLWWNAAESGWGLNVVQHGNIAFAAWYTYDSSGNPKWYVAPRCPLYDSGVGQGCISDVYEVHGPIPFTGAPLQATNVGFVEFDFPDSGNASMFYEFLRAGDFIVLTREPLRSGPALPIDYSDLWWNPAESGWGLVITQESNVMFLALYVFDGSGNPVWYVAPDCEVASSGQSCTGALYKTAGPALGTRFDPSKVHATHVGTATVTFSDASNGTLSYTINNSNVPTTKPITRQAF